MKGRSWRGYQILFPTYYSDVCKTQSFSNYHFSQFFQFLSLSSSSVPTKDCSGVLLWWVSDTKLYYVLCFASVFIMFCYLSNFPHYTQILSQSKTFLTYYSDELQPKSFSIHRTPLFLDNNELIGKMSLTYSFPDHVPIVIPKLEIDHVKDVCRVCQVPDDDLVARYVDSAVVERRLPGDSHITWSRGRGKIADWTRSNNIYKEKERGLV